MDQKVSLIELIKAWRKIYEDHWNTCKLPTCSTCMRTNGKSWIKTDE